MSTHNVSSAPARWHHRPGHRILFKAPLRIDPRLLWTICAGLSFLAAATLAVLELSAQGWNQLSDPLTGPTRWQVAVLTFVFSFVGAFVSSSTLAFSSMGLLGLAQERRRRPERRPLNVGVAVVGQRGAYTGTSRNVSVGGLFLATSEAHEVGERLKLQFQLPGHDVHHSVEAEVRWTRRDVTPGLGLLFIDPPRSLKSAIRRLLASSERRSSHR